MPSCAVVICKNRSNVSNFKTCGVTYHIFPKEPIWKEKWIEACGRKDNWFPTKYSVICSLHFAEDCFQPLDKCRRLFPNAVPTLKLRMVFDTSSKNSNEKLRTKKNLTNPSKMKTIVEKYKIQIEKYKKAMKTQDMKIKRLQKMTGRYRKKAETMKNILTALKNENVIGEDHFWLMESDSITKVKVLTANK